MRGYAEDSFQNVQKILEDFLTSHTLETEEYFLLLQHLNCPQIGTALREEAVRLRVRYYGNKIYLRGLIEFTNYCKNNCYYCGIRRGNQKVCRYRLTLEEILACCKEGYQLGFRTFVLQGGEDPYFTDEKLVPIVTKIKTLYPDCALTLSVGERSYESYLALKQAGADRYLLRHETADETLYQSLHPEEMSLQNRMQCLEQLKSLDYQVGAGMMVGSPGQSLRELAKDLTYLQKLQPQMVGVGPFLPHQDTSFANKTPGDLTLTLGLLSMIRIMLPNVLLPATTALATLDPQGREQGLQAGCNVIMPNLSPMEHRKDYALYNHKQYTGQESAQSVALLKQTLTSLGYEIVTDRGDALDLMPD